MVEKKSEKVLSFSSDSCVPQREPCLQKQMWTPSMTQNRDLGNRNQKKYRGKIGRELGNM